MNLVAAWPRLMRPDIAVEYVGGQSIFDKLRKAFFIAPKVQTRRLVVYDIRQLDSGITAAGEAGLFDSRPKKKRRYSLSPAVRLRILERDGYNCFYCPEKADSVDHKIPHVRDGSDEDENLVAACMDCNRKKHAKTAEEFLS